MDEEDTFEEEQTIFQTFDNEDEDDFEIADEEHPMEEEWFEEDGEDRTRYN